MSFSAQSEWLEPVTAGVPGSFKAREISSGRPVLVHLLARGDNRFRNLPSKRRAQVLSQGEYEGLEFVVLPEGVSFDEWVGSAHPDLLFQTGQWDITEIHRVAGGAIGGQRAGAGGQGATPPSSNEPGEFTRMFSAAPSEAPKEVQLSFRDEPTLVIPAAQPAAATPPTRPEEEPTQA